MSIPKLKWHRCLIVLAPGARLSWHLVLFLCFTVIGCSLPTAASQRQLYSITREEKKVKGAFGKKKFVLIRDFRGNEVYEEDMELLKTKVEGYIASHPDLNESIKVDLRELKLTEGNTQEEVELLLGKPDRVLNSRNTNYGRADIWIYKIKKLRAFTVFIVPVFFVHEGYYLYFSEDFLKGIERHYLTQIVQQGSAPGVFQEGGKTSAP